MSSQVVEPQRPAGQPDPATEMSMRRTGMSFQRTRMSADRTLMSVIRTSLSLIGFGFTIFQVFQKAHEAGMLKSGKAPLNFGISLVLLGIAVLVVGIGYHVVFMSPTMTSAICWSFCGVL